jgi:hypothetical protein
VIEAEMPVGRKPVASEMISLVASYYVDHLGFS